MTMQGSELRELRKRADMTQGEVADYLGLSVQAIGMMERGERPIERRTELLAHVLPGYNVLAPMIPGLGWAVIRRFKTPGAHATKLYAIRPTEEEAELCAAEFRKGLRSHDEF